MRIGGSFPRFKVGRGHPFGAKVKMACSHTFVPLMPLISEYVRFSGAGHSCSTANRLAASDKELGDNILWNDVTYTLCKQRKQTTPSQR